MMISLLKTIFTGIVFSCYFFPFEFTFLPGINTKMILAVVGLLLLVIRWGKNREVNTSKEMLLVSAWAIFFSLISLFAVTYNDTTDYVYATYIVKMWVWLAAAYSVLALIKEIHKDISVQLVFHYMAWVCAVQSVLGIVIDNVPAVQSMVDEYILHDVEFLHKTRRLYGIGAFFDTAGIRFSCALLGLGYLLTHNVSRYWFVIYWVLFFLIATLGNMMSRTTTVGLFLSLIYITVNNLSFNVILTPSKMRTFAVVAILTILAAVSLYYGYNNSPIVRHYLQYGFEVFFNFFNSGELSTSSTTKLQQMVVWPDNLKTWIIGDGWFDNPENPGSFYKYTDVGYLRFIFYCGTLGLTAFILFFVYCTYVLIKKWREETWLFLLMLILVLLVWIKISTDIFCMYALLLLLDSKDNSIRNKVLN